ncbi:hypothetical protein B481_2448 [Planococcus halocryophilus Or1]|uniref:DUF4181 domain-containing protein n=1 Tax=Planococcus halocryophilus TaxID=1215089 RepID=A0A1C7DSM0_9BACL|nr:DUF4181 domain-containing protein [Planococcus halocryophilus]ANU14392.1 hypothetical protein BBI08_11155 [Planococcus halocryophilus]EMF46114.1 hypothetical protein B481_2448 [Planococcus halocryophilus Or1]
MEIVFFLWFVIIIGFAFLRMFLKKRFGINQEEQAGIPVKKFERWNNWLMILAIIVLAVNMQNSLESFFFWIFMIFFVGNATQIFLEWKYLKGSRKYQVSLINSMLGGLAIIIFITVAITQMN